MGLVLQEEANDGKEDFEEHCHKVDKKEGHAFMNSENGY